MAEIANSVDLIYGIVKSINSYLSGKKVETFMKRGFGNLKEYEFNNYKRIYNEIENSYYTHHDLILYILYTSLWDYRFGYKVRTWKYKEVDQVKTILTKEKLKEDRERIIKLAEKTGVAKIEKYFDINSNGSCIAFDLMDSKYITPMFVIKYMDKYLKLDDVTEETKRKLIILKGIKQQLNA